MSNCSICHRKITRTRQFYLNSMTCTQCITNTDDCNYTIDGKESNFDNIHNVSIDIPSNHNSLPDENDLITIDCGVKANITSSTEIDIVCQNDFNVQESFKDALLASLYSQIIFLKNEIEEKNILIRTLISKDYTVHDNIDTSSIRSDADYVTRSEYGIDNKIDISIDDPADLTETSIDHEIPRDNLDDNAFFLDLHQQYEDFNRIDNEIKIEKRRNIDNQLFNIRLMKHEEFVRLSKCSEDNNIKRNEFIDRGIKRSDLMKDVVQENCDNLNKYEWLKYSSGLASKIIHKMGYKGKGLGKNEDGIEEAIKVDDTKFSMKDTKSRVGKLLYIASSSMLNQMDEERLSRGNINVKVRCHGGCTVKCMYSHLPEMFNLKPDFVLLHIGSNDCIGLGKTSDEILQEIKKLVEYISWNLPYSKLIISLPIVRADSSVANAVQQILNFKLKRSFFPCLDNSNVGLSHLGKKGLHLNHQGTRLMASNIISLIKRL